MKTYDKYNKIQDVCIKSEEEKIDLTAQINERKNHHLGTKGSNSDLISF
jgi:hypothetical protein